MGLHAKNQGVKLGAGKGSAIGLIFPCFPIPLIWPEFAVHDFISLVQPCMRVLHFLLQGEYHLKATDRWYLEIVYKQKHWPDLLMLLVARK